MLEFIDYSSRRGAIVPLLPKVHALLKENAERDKPSGLEPPANIVTWRQQMNPQLLDISRRFVFAMEKKGAGREVVGFVFYRYDTQKKNTLYIEDMQIAWEHRNDPAILTGLITKLENDPSAKNCELFGSERLKLMADKEILAGVGFRDHFPEGWEPLGKMKEAMGSLKLRYGRGKA
jgi:hypothetical protein